VTQTLTCRTTAFCTGSVKILVPVAGSSKLRFATTTASGRSAKVIGTATFRIKPHHTLVLKIHLTKAGKAYLRQHKGTKRHPAKLKLLEQVSSKSSHHKAQHYAKPLTLAVH
jgi:hypothetical protein